jgi:YVTN family beta-propeller protein
MAILPDASGNETLAVVANANISLTQSSGSLVPIDLTSHTLLTGAAVSIPSFAGYLSVDTARSRIYVPDRGDDALLIYGYSLGGTNSISISPLALPTPADLTTNGMVTDDNPVSVALLRGATAADDFLLVTNLVSGSLTMAPAETLVPLDLNPRDPILNGYTLISAANFPSIDRKPGRGANRMVPSPDGSLLYVTSTMTNDLYVIDAKDRGIEAMLDLSPFSPSVGTRGMVISAANLAYIVHRGMNSLIVLDVSSVVDNGIDFEVVEPLLVDVIPLGKDPEGIALSPTRGEIYVTHSGDNTMMTIDVATRKVRTVTPLPGRSPGEVILDRAEKYLYILNFLSNDITYIDLDTRLMGTIR